MEVIAFLTDYAVLDRIIDHLKLSFVADKPPPPRLAHTECGYPQFSYAKGIEWGYKNLAVLFEACTFKELALQGTLHGDRNIGS